MSRIKGNPQKHIYEVKPCSLLLDMYPCVLVIPTGHIILKNVNTVVPFVLVNLSTEFIFSA